MNGGTGDSCPHALLLIAFDSSALHIDISEDVNLHTIYISRMYGRTQDIDVGYEAMSFHRIQTAAKLSLMKSTLSQSVSDEQSESESRRARRM